MGRRGSRNVRYDDRCSFGAALPSLLLPPAAADDRIAQDDGQKQDPTWCNQEEDPEQDANDDGHAFSYEHLSCHAQWASRRVTDKFVTRIGVS